MKAPPWPAPFSIRAERTKKSTDRRQEREKLLLQIALEEMVMRGELCACETKRGRAYFIPLAKMENRLW